MNLTAFKPLLTLSYWFNLSSEPFLPIVDRILLVLVALCLAVGVGFAIASRQKGLDKEARRVLKRLMALALWAGVAGLLLYWFTWQGLPVLSMRIFWVAWVGGFGYWKVVILRDYFIERPKRQKAAAERAAYEKWLPKPKK